MIDPDMITDTKNMVVGIIGAGAMGRGIAQVAGTAGHRVILYDSHLPALEQAAAHLRQALDKLFAKGKISSPDEIYNRFSFTDNFQDFSSCGLIIEAIIEQEEAKKQVFKNVEKHISGHCLLATNTSSLSVTALAAACASPGRFAGLHFFNPPPLMALVEVVPAIQTDAAVIKYLTALMQEWGKIPVVAKDTPGFIVNRVARPFYGEALRIYEEGIADIATIDYAMTHVGGFKMGPFALMDYIGHDVNYVVTDTVFRSFFYDPRYKPSFSQKRLLEAGWLGRKSGKGFYDYAPDASLPEPDKNPDKAQKIFERIWAMLINEAVDALYLRIAGEDDLDLAMTKGVNYPKGLLSWCREAGAGKCLSILDQLYETYHEDRYRASPLLRKMASANPSENTSGTG